MGIMIDYIPKYPFSVDQLTTFFIFLTNYGNELSRFFTSYGTRSVFTFYESPILNSGHCKAQFRLLTRNEDHTSILTNATPCRLFIIYILTVSLVFTTMTFVLSDLHCTITI